MTTNLMNHAQNKLLILFGRRLTIVNHISIIPQRILILHQITLSCHRLINHSHTLEIFRFSHQMRRCLFFCLFWKDLCKNAVNLLSISQFIDQCVDVIFCWILFHLRIQPIKLCVTLSNLFRV